MRSKLKFSIIILLGVLFFVLALFVADHIKENSEIQDIVSGFGYFGVLFVAIVAGLNTFVPLPSATFAPIFISSGLSVFLIIVVMALGTLIADAIGFALGHASREIVKEKYPKIFNYAFKLQNRHQHLVIPIVITYSSLVPFPNEAILIPLALAGAKFRYLILPLMIGNLIHQTLLVYGVTSVFGVWF